MSACGHRFVEPNPPELASFEIVHSLAFAEEPVIYGFLFDLNLPDPADCEAQRAKWRAQAAAAFLPRDRVGLELEPIDLSVDCLQGPERRLDVFRLETAIDEAARAFPGRNVRPIWIYLNNVELPLPKPLGADFRTLRARMHAREHLAPALWGFARAPVLEEVSFDWSVQWTHASDPMLFEALTQKALQAVPFVTRPIDPDEVFALLRAEQAQPFEAGKVCDWDYRAQPDGLSVDGSAQPARHFVDAGYRVLLPALFVAPRAEAISEPLKFRLELCSAHCDRFWEDPPGTLGKRWNETSWCISELVSDENVGSEDASAPAEGAR